MGATLSGVVAQPKLNCHVGPITKSYGGTDWLVYSCDDQRSVVFMAAPSSPATPFYFILLKQESGHQLMGEGTGNRDATGAAFSDLKKLSEKEIGALIEQTKAK